MGLSLTIVEKVNEKTTCYVPTSSEMSPGTQAVTGETKEPLCGSHKLRSEKTLRPFFALSWERGRGVGFLVFERLKLLNHRLVDFKQTQE